MIGSLHADLLPGNPHVDDICLKVDDLLSLKFAVSNVTMLFFPSQIMAHLHSIYSVYNQSPNVSSIVCIR